MATDCSQRIISVATLWLLFEGGIFHGFPRFALSPMASYCRHSRGLFTASRSYEKYRLKTLKIISCHFCKVLNETIAKVLAPFPCLCLCKAVLGLKVTRASRCKKKKVARPSRSGKKNRRRGQPGLGSGTGKGKGRDTYAIVLMETVIEERRM